MYQRIIFYIAFSLQMFVYEAFAQEKITVTGAFQARNLVIDKDDSLQIFVKVFFNPSFQEINEESIKKRFKIFYRVKEDYDNPNWQLNSAEISWATTKILVDRYGFAWSFTIPKSRVSPTGLLIIDLMDNEESRKHQILFNLTFAKTKIREDFAVFAENSSFPLLSGFLEEEKSFQLRNLTQQSTNFYVTRFRDDYEAALLPMNLSKPKQKANLEVDTVFQVRSNQAIKLPKGLYLIRQDTAAFYGIGLRIEPAAYPNYTQKEQLISSLAYIAQQAEIEKIQKSEDIKSAVDYFWLNLYRGEALKAKEVVKKYYERVRKANYRYATFKEGWKTDMGMIFIIFGEPDEVQTEKNNQKWIYKGNEGYANDKGKRFTRLVFTFSRRPNQFFEDYYTLLRYIEYENIWETMIGAIRKGTAF
ncbi:MAG: GWxTD domain-containing protein [Thermonemataceae bacterium]|nr:GWxTD domain-containing protein [Thermonemataceae bacterium]